ncbi:SRPBCC family protein [Elizabethkingia anophelis]|uniref:SRPBCC family protein n=1 Tax=Elizabethkingia anophelis TaxID=1117645 RepID=UPI0035569508
MKKFFKIMLWLFAIVFILLTVTMFVLGKKYHYEKSITINATPDKIWPHINSMKALNEWSPYMSLDPDMKRTYSGTSGEVGDTFMWESNKKEAGTGEQKLIEIVLGQSVKTSLHFIKPNEGLGVANLALNSEGNQTKVTWSLDTEMNYPMNLMKLFMDGFMDDAYGRGLKSLKEISEK